MQVTIEIKNIYGNETIYPVCDKALTFAKMLGQKTLTRKDLASIKALGFELSLKQPEFAL